MWARSSAVVLLSLPCCLKASLYCFAQFFNWRSCFTYLLKENLLVRPASVTCQGPPGKLHKRAIMCSAVLCGACHASKRPFVAWNQHAHLYLVLNKHHVPHVSVIATIMSEMHEAPFSVKAVPQMS